jgi:hypothetical protein
MTRHSMTVMVPPLVDIPRGATWAADAATRLLGVSFADTWQSAPSAPAAREPGPMRRALNRIGQSIWAAMEARGQARAERELRHLADLYDTSSPDLARELRAALASGPSAPRA